MRYLILISLFAISLFANTFYSKLKPFNTYTIKAATSGKVIFTNDKLEGKFAQNSTIVKLDSYVDEVDLKQTLNKLDSINKMIKIEQRNYDRMMKVSSKSAFEKDNQKLKVINLESTKADVLIKIANLKDSIKNKKLVEKSNYIFNIDVKKGNYVNAGTLLYEAMDLSKGKLEIFVPIADIEKIKNSIIYINDKKTDLKLSKIYNVADTEHISSYKVEIIIPKAKNFSKLIKIDFKTK